MASYRCYFLDQSEHIHGSADVEAAGLEEAIDLALEMLKGQYSRKCEFIEIWQGDQRLYPATGGETNGSDAGNKSISSEDIMPGQRFSMAGHIVFLRQAAAELRAAASHDSEIAEMLRHMADQMDAEVDDLQKVSRFKGVGFF